MKSAVMDDSKLIKYKTVMCQRMVRSGSCRYGHLCDFAHHNRELRRNLNQYWYEGIRCDKSDHDDPKCDFAHNEMEIIYHPNVYKTILCDNFASSQGCPKNQYCADAHGKMEFRTSKFTSAPQRSLCGGSDSRGGGTWTSHNTGATQQAYHHHHSASAALHDTHEQHSTVNPLTPIQHHQASFNAAAGGNGSGATMAFDAQHNDMHAATLDITHGDVKEFQDGTNEIKIRILDMVDQISAMHFDRAAYDGEKSKSVYANENIKLNSLLQDSYSRLQQQTQENITLTSQYEERIQALQHQLDESNENLRRQKVLAQAYSGDVDALNTFSNKAAEQLATINRSAARAIATRVATVSVDTDVTSLVQDISELDISESSAATTSTTTKVTPVDALSSDSPSIPI